MKPRMWAIIAILFLMLVTSACSVGFGVQGGPEPAPIPAPVYAYPYPPAFAYPVPAPYYPPAGLLSSAEPGCLRGSAPGGVWSPPR